VSHADLDRSSSETPANLDTTPDASDPGEMAMASRRGQRADEPGAELVRASNRFAVEDIATTWRLFATTMLAYLGALGVVFAAPWWGLQLAASIVAGLVLVRLFIFYHDYLHGAIFRGSAAGKAVMYAVGVVTLNPPSVWKETHDYHHKNNAKLIGSAIGSYPVLPVKVFNNLPVSDQRKYAALRHPLTIATAWFTMFIVGMCFVPFQRNPKLHWQGPVVVALHFGAIALATALFGGWIAALTVWLPVVVALTSGAYLFYAQHNFPTAEFRDRTKWNYTFAALRSSSMFEMSPLMHWFTGNIGYHHVHHLNHRIPFYRLPEAMAAMPELQNPGRTSWALSDILACFELKLWDPEKGRMVGWPS
jgi:omega-6 fatty acid desaturase (delta-12 desaturase)